MQDRTSFIGKLYKVKRGKAGQGKVTCIGVKLCLFEQKMYIIYSANTPMKVCGGGVKKSEGKRGVKSGWFVVLK